MTDVDLAELAASRRYPTFGPEDDDFHDEVLSDRWWETETNWFSWNVPERRLGGWTYCQARPNANICNGGAWVWDDSGAYSWDLRYHAEYSGLRLVERAERDMRDFEWPNGVHVATLESLQKYRIDYEDPGALELHLVFDALIPPNPHPVGVSPFFNGTHFDQPGHLTGEMVLHGERIPIDCYSVRDRSWGPRPAGRRRPRPADDTRPQPVFGGVGYSFGTEGPADAWLTYSAPTEDDDPVVCGFLLRDGEYGHFLTGRRHVDVDPGTGWPIRIEIEAFDDHGRRLDAVGIAVSRHWKGLGGDTLMNWQWHDGHQGWGEDQSYFARSVWAAQKARAGSA